MGDYLVVEPNYKDEATGEYKLFSCITQADTVKMSDGTTVEQNLGGILDTLKNVVGEPNA